MSVSTKQKRKLGMASTQLLNGEKKLKETDVTVKVRQRGSEKDRNVPFIHLFDLKQF